MNRQAPTGTIWVCAVCGRTAHWRYGFDNCGKNCGPSTSWDASCMSNAVLCEETKVDGNWKAVGDEH